ncbi:hypothetical protein NDU88_001682, partial [Pleurodeles waltl]
GPQTLQGGLGYWGEASHRKYLQKNEKPRHQSMLKSKHLIAFLSSKTKNPDAFRQQHALF